MTNDSQAPSGPKSHFAWEAIVEIGERVSLGESPLGTRFMIPILGGRIEGPRLQGLVLPGGADRQLWRPDGARLLDAFYEIQADDGSIITVRNRVLIDDPEGPRRYAMSQIVLVAPRGPHEWVNRRVFVGTLRSLKPARNAVAVGFYWLE